MRAETEICENCGTMIGALEAPWLYQGHVVCTNCYRRLQTVSPRPQCAAMKLPITAENGNATVQEPRTPQANHTVWQDSPEPEIKPLSGVSILSIGLIIITLGEGIGWVLWEMGRKRFGWGLPDIADPTVVAWAIGIGWIGRIFGGIFILAGIIRWSVFADKRPH